MDNNFILTTHIWVDIELVSTLSDFKKRFNEKGDKIILKQKNDINQLQIEFYFKTSEAIIWLYTWIHTFLLNGKIDKSHDFEIQWITGSLSFIDAVYVILYNTHYTPEGIPLNQVKV